jgi:hypothetical protein
MISDSGDHNAPTQFFPYTDRSLTGPEEGPDELSRQGFCNEIGSLLFGYRDLNGVVISIEGKWGSGKTSALAMIKECLCMQQKLADNESAINLMGLPRLKRWLRRYRQKPPFAPHNRAPVLVEFNPWLVGAAEHMIQAFMAQIASELGQDNLNSIAAKAADGLIAYAQLLEPLKWIPGAEPWSSIAKGALEKTGKGAKKISDLHKLNISRQRDTLKQLLLNLGRNIIVFIDDIDRLPPAEVFQIVRAIQAISDLPRCSFVIALDPLYTEKALQSAASVQSPGHYLDKIIQLRLPLPQLNKTDLVQFFEIRLSRALSPLQQDRFNAEQERLSHIWNLGVKPLLETPRDAIRIINRFLFLEPKCGSEVCWGDLLGLQAIAIILPDVFRQIIENPGAYTGKDVSTSYQRSSPQEHLDQFAEERSSALETLPKQTRIQALRLLEELFPLLRTYPYDKLSQQQFSKSRRIAAADRLRIVLAYDLPSDEVSMTDLETFCYEEENRGNVLNGVLARGLLDHFLGAALQRIDPSKVTDRQALILCLGRLVEDQRIDSRFEGFRSLFHLSTMNAIILLSEKVLSSSVDADDLASLHDIVSVADIISLSTNLLARRLSKRIGQSQKSENSSELTLITSSEDPVLDAWLDTSVSIFSNQVFANIADKSIVIRVLLLFHEGRERLPNLLLPYLDSDQSIDAIAEIFISNEMDSTEGTSVSCKNEYLTMLGDLEAIRGIAECRLRDSSIQADKRLCAIYKSIVHQRKYFIESAEQDREREE